jgi:hypothetical protein
MTLLNSVDTFITRHYGFVKRFSVLTTHLAKDVPPKEREKALVLFEIKQTALRADTQNCLRRDASPGLRHQLQRHIHPGLRHR